jgi:hypothetical protein
MKIGVDRAHINNKLIWKKESLEIQNKQPNKPKKTGIKLEKYIMLVS